MHGYTVFAVLEEEVQKYDGVVSKANKKSALPARRRRDQSLADKGER